MDLVAMTPVLGTLQAGVEYQIWRSKFGVKGVDEGIPQVMVKWTM